MKKFLSLVLALVMTMSLVTISAGAKDFTDDSKLNYSEAVDVMSEVKVVDGYADGSFNPQATLTRGAAAKIICNLILGPTTASALAADAAPYSDVPANSTFAGYIAFCQKEGIISGYADGTFKPGNSLTGYAFMKMLLGALGYDADIEGYTGNNWSINVAKRALNIGLDEGLVGDFNGVKAVTREEACLYALNTLTAAVVEYETKGTSITIGDTTINTGASNAEKFTTGNTGKLDVVGDGKYVQFGEKYFKDLKAEDDKDSFGRPAVKWTLKAQKIDSYGKTPILTYTEQVDGNDIYEDLGKPSIESVTVYTDGSYNKANPTDNTVFNVKSDNAHKIGGSGIVVQVYSADTDGDNKDEIVVVAVTNRAEKVQSVTPARGDNKRYVTLENGEKFETKEFEVDDIVVYTKAKTSATENKVKTMVLAEKIPDVDVDKINFTKSTFTDGTTTYDFAAHYAGDLLATDSTYDVYTDANGKVVYIAETEASTPKYAVVLATRTANWTDGKAEIRLLLADGTEVEAKCDSITDLAFQDVVTYTVDKDGVYSCTEISGTARETALPDVASTDEITTGVSKLGTSGKYANADTVFVVATKNGGKYDEVKVYTGIKNVPDVNVNTGTAKIYTATSTSTMAELVLLVDTSLTDTDVVFLSSVGYAKYTNRDGVSYYQFNAVVDGEITTLDILATEASAKLDPAGNGKWDHAAFMVTNYTTNSKDIVTSINLGAQNDPAVGDNTYVGKVTTSFRKDTVQIGKVTDGTSPVDYTVSDDVTVYVVDNNGDITTAGASALAVNEKVLFNVEDGVITTALVYTDLDTASTPWVG